MASTTLRLGLSLIKPSGSSKSVTVASRKPTVGRVAARKLHTSKMTRVDAGVHAFGRLIKAAVVEKDTKQKAGTKEKYTKTDGGIGLGSFLDDQKAEADRAIDSDNEEQKAELGTQQEGVFDTNIARAKAVVDASNAHAIDPLFSLRAQAKSYELHKVNPHFWNAARLANLFRVSLARMRINLWLYKLDEQAKSEGFVGDDTIERLLGEKYGELDFPGDIAQVPDRIRFKQRRDTYFFVDDEVKSDVLMKALRTKGMVHYREAPRLPKKSIPAVRSLPPRLASRTNYTTQPGKFRSTFYMWDISKSKDIYNRQIVVRETDGSYRTGNWQERRYAEDYRRFIKWPLKTPFVRPDENEPDHVPAYARVPEGFKVEFEKFD